MDVGPLQDIQLDSDFSWEIKTIVFYYIYLKSKNQVLKNIPPWWTWAGPLQDSQLDSDFSWEIKTIMCVLYWLEIKESGP